MMKKVLTGSVVSVQTGDNDEMRKDPRSSVVVDFEGFAGDGHRSFTRTAYAGEKEPEGTLRRNDRQWSAVSTEELLAIQGQLELAETLSATDLGANLCVAGIPDFSRLPRGTRLVFPSGATLMVEAYNPPCADMSKKIARSYTTTSGVDIRPFAFSKAAKRLRGLVGVVDVPGIIHAGDEFTAHIYQPPPWS